jgi:hypothetical protein
VNLYLTTQDVAGRDVVGELAPADDGVEGGVAVAPAVGVPVAGRHGQAEGGAQRASGGGAQLGVGGEVADEGDVVQHGGLRAASRGRLTSSSPAGRAVVGDGPLRRSVHNRRGAASCGHPCRAIDDAQWMTLLPMAAPGHAPGQQPSRR